MKAPLAPLRKAVFLDRDGVINEERRYVHRIEDCHLLPGVITALQLLQREGWALVVVTNQAGIARGFYTEADLEKLHTHLRRMLSEQGVVLDGIYFCPHHPTAGQGAYRMDCGCRKPQPGMLLRAAAELRLHISTSVLVGDKRSDLEAGRAAGLAACVLVRSGHPISEADCRFADSCTDDLLRAAVWITRQVVI